MFKWGALYKIDKLQLGFMEVPNHPGMDFENFHQT